MIPKDDDHPLPQLSIMPDIITVRRLSPWQRGYDFLRTLNAEFKTQREVTVSQQEWDQVKAYLKIKGVPLEQHRP